ncbi:alpha/beta fold hydrolase [Furfurilactobacillus rossiae]|uniref:Alpha beta fold family hydrolase n=1 Tax=Furfurilactobacillus rossiae DSM 15814 TaxID=1114972 RepID=A0A0R1R8H5_9LACO|nr:alpha/beta hydrolase [Furfurilactobacillus rossiae]KRL53469.1 alpha beta fold family hydrolase [Furfurilactobacillus rossiae DSM 15814]QFR67609.1 alpha/beta fold hydrolase [Furfurilactobacillus rossiae]QLE60568.1 Hydrolase alpha-beta fold protein [Furfurilactobacillus rossiae]
MTTYNTTDVNGLNIFYREAGDSTKPTMILLHGFPTASHMFRELMPLLADQFHLIAPDFPGFGQSSAPDHATFAYTFDHLTDVVTAFIEQLNIDKFYMYVFDYGAPIGFRIALRHPDWILGIVSQNGNVYQEGLGNKWAERQDFWDHPTEAKRNSYRNAFATATIKDQYTFGTQPGTVSPDGYTLDIAYTRTAGYADRQLDLIYDYQNNIKMYPEFQAYLRQYQPKLLAVWGKNDPSFIYPGAEAFQKDDVHAKVAFVDSGHFALETHAAEIAQMMIEYFIDKR